MKEIRDGFIEVNGLKLHYVSQGPKDGKTVLFLHGFPEFWYAWKDQLNAFGEHAHAVALDMRGYNLSDKPPSPFAYTSQRLASDICETLKQLSRGKKAVLVGHDWGGVIAWSVAMDYPSLLERLVILNAPHPKLFKRELTRNPLQQLSSLYMLFFRIPGLAERLLRARDFALLKLMVFGFARKGAVFSDEDRQRYVTAWSQPGALTGGLNYYRAISVHGRRSHKIDVPTLVIWGEKDPALRASNLRGLDEWVSQLRIERIPTATHWVAHEESRRVTALLQEFIFSDTAEATSR